MLPLPPGAVSRFFLGVCNPPPPEYPENASFLQISWEAWPQNPQLPDGRPVTPHLS